MSSGLVYGHSQADKLEGDYLYWNSFALVIESTYMSLLQIYFINDTFLKYFRENADGFYVHCFLTSNSSFLK